MSPFNLAALFSPRIWSSLFLRRKKTQKVNFDKECVECKWYGFYNVFNRFHCSIELWRMVMNQVGRKNFVEKPPTFVPLGKSPVMRAIFAGPLLTPLFSRAAFSWRLVCESLPWEWAHGSFFLPLFGIFFVAPFIVRARISGQHENWKESVGDSFLCGWEQEEERYFWHFEKVRNDIERHLTLRHSYLGSIINVFIITEIPWG